MSLPLVVAQALSRGCAEVGCLPTPSLGDAQRRCAVMMECRVRWAGMVRVRGWISALFEVRAVDDKSMMPSGQGPVPEGALGP